MRKIVSASWSWQGIKTQEPDEFMSAYISTYYENVKWIFESIWGSLGSLHMAWYKNCVLKDTKITSWAYERVEGEGYEMSKELHIEQAGSKFHFQGASPVEFLVYGPKLWNSIDPAIVCKSRNWHSFKKLFNKYLLSKYIWWLIIF